MKDFIKELKGLDKYWMETDGFSGGAWMATENEFNRLDEDDDEDIFVKLSDLKRVIEKQLNKD